MKFLPSLLVRNVVTKLLWEAFLALFRRVSWQQVIEHAAMRLVKIGLRHLAARTKNTVDDEIVEDIIAQLEQRGVDKV